MSDALSNASSITVPPAVVPRFYVLAGRASAEIPADWMFRRDPELPGMLPDFRTSAAVQVAPDVWVAGLGWGDLTLPDGSMTRGCRIAVWREAE